MPGIGIIANPYSKMNKRDPWRKDLLSYIVGSQGRFEVTQSIKELQNVALGFYKQDIEIIGINGGDGTVSQTLSALIHVYKDKPLPKIALLKGGTMNMLAANLGIRGQPEQLLFKLVEAYSSAKPVKHTTLYTLKIDERYGFLFGTGLAANFLKEFYEKKSGSMGVVWLILKLVVSKFFSKNLYNRIIISDQINLSVENGPKITLSSCGTLVSTVRKIPMKVPLFHQIGAFKKGFGVLSFALKKNEIIKKLPFLAMNIAIRPKYKNERHLLNMLAKQLTINCPKNSLYTLDGELFAAQDGNIEISLGPPIQFLVV